MKFQDFFGGDKRDRTADLMTASCYRLVILGGFVSNTSVLTAKSVGFCEVLSTASTRFRAHLGHNLGQDIQIDLIAIVRQDSIYNRGKLVNICPYFLILSQNQK